MDKPMLAPALLAELHALDGRHWRRLASFIALYVVAAAGALLIAQDPPGGPVGYLLCLPFYLVAAAALHGISLFVHEGVHGTLSRRAWLNHVVSVLCAMPVLQSFAAYRVLHLRHHSCLGKEGDPDHYPNYTRWTWLQFTMYWGRLILGYPVYITAIPILGFLQGSRTDRIYIGLEAAVLAAVVVGVLVSPLPWALLLHAWLIPMLLINTMVNIRGMSQHTLLEHCTDTILGTRSILTNPVTRYFVCNENYHLEHHLYPGVPWYQLPQLHRALSDDLRARGAPFIASYLAFVRDFVVGSWRRCPLGRGVARG
jgi:fatty acid desaturase